MKPFLNMIGLTCLLASCSPLAVELTPQGQQVQLMQAEILPPNCIKLGDLKAVALVGEHNPYRQALRKTQNKAGLLRATHIRVERTEAHRMATTLYSTALSCSPEDGEEVKPDPEKLIILD